MNNIFSNWKWKSFFLGRFLSNNFSSKSGPDVTVLLSLFQIIFTCVGMHSSVMINRSALGFPWGDVTFILSFFNYSFFLLLFLLFVNIFFFLFFTFVLILSSRQVRRNLVFLFVNFTLRLVLFSWAQGQKSEEKDCIAPITHVGRFCSENLCSKSRILIWFVYRSLSLVGNTIALWDFFLFTCNFYGFRESQDMAKK